MRQIYDKLVKSLPALDIKLFKGHISFEKFFFAQENYLVTFKILFESDSPGGSLRLLMSASYPDYSPSSGDMSLNSKIVIDYLNRTQKVRSVFSNILKGLLLSNIPYMQMKNDFNKNLFTEIIYDGDDLEKIMDEIIILLKLFLMDD